MRRFWRLVAGLTAAVGVARAEKSAKYPKSISLAYELLGSSASASSPLATVDYDPRSLEYVLSSWTPPSVDSLKSTSQEPTSTPLVRVLLPDGGATVTGLGSFANDLSQNINIWISPESGELISASITSITPPPLSKEEELQKQKEERLRKRGKEIPTKPKPKSKSASKKMKEAIVPEVQAGPVVRVNLLVADQGPIPKLNSRKPPQVDAEGKEVIEEEQPEKTFLQKYWYIILALTFMLITSMGGKE